MRGKVEMHDFYCPKCAEKIYTLPRQVNHKYQKHHRKKLWCWKCRLELNCIEVRNDTEAKEFKELWKAGTFKEEVANSINYNIKSGVVA